MTGLTEETQKKRELNVVNASELYRIMGGYDDPPPKEPDRGVESYDQLYDHVKPLYEKGQRMFYVDDLKDLVGHKVTAVDRDLIVKAVVFDLPKPIPEPIITYAHERAKKMHFYDPEYDNPDTYSMRIGRNREPDAMVELSKWSNLEFKFTGEDQKHKSLNGVGSTPDGLAAGDDDLIEVGGETKCFAPERHLDCCLLVNQQQLRKEQFDIFCQTQAGMYAHKLQRWLVGFYNPWSKTNQKLKFKGMEVLRDEFFLMKMEERVQMCRSVINERLAEIEKVK